ncbi:hypothetical protein BS50DRAFT_20702 [Corynespora cassiicola Philippines]|uniref:Uncharacterized protein n=1 Tax=Corynespora cassiicola Philippines TaxID=1448308 RepID=A0A2T2PB87_CORCC|nr:hypothetical protein BS50DRAFT_20702 [Corynespora cassiicola Philippines]
MPNVLVLSFEGFSFSSRQLYEGLLPKLLSRAVVHESLTVQDGLTYILAGWPSIVLITDPVVTIENEETEELLSALADYTKHGCITILMGVFAAAVDHDKLEEMLKLKFDLPWRVSEEMEAHTSLHILDENLIRVTHLVPEFTAHALYLSRVPAAQTVYVGSITPSPLAYAAYGRVGLGKLGYIGDMSFGEEAELLILAMAHLDRPEDRIHP